MNLLIMKFGGTSVGSAERIKNLKKLVVDERPKIVVLSAMSGTTNALVEISDYLIKNNKEGAITKIEELENKYRKTVEELFEKKEFKEKGHELVRQHFDFIRSFTTDMFTVHEEKIILAQGELLSTTLFHYHLNECQIPSVLLPALHFMRIDEHHEPDFAYIEKHLKEELSKHPGTKLFITQGYICRNAFGEIDNLKRGGSDYTASILGAVLKSPAVEIWTDIDGMHNNDPRFVSKTHPIHRLSFDEAAELAYFGAKILHPTCILPARNKNIPVWLKNTMQPEAHGTLISQFEPEDGFRAVAAKDNITAISIKSGRMLLAYGFLRAVFEIFERHKTPIDMITTSEVAVSLTIDDTSRLNEIQKELSEIATVEVDHDQSIICIVGKLPRNHAGYAAKVMNALKDIPLRMVSYGGSENNISVLLHSQYKVKALKLLNKHLFGYDEEI
ncbi:MAG: aspartate kinase [Bacteroidia bacterium]|nr:aspartate kinase [Bacteroidia bacterium]